jgi:hypothetical protein
LRAQWLAGLSVKPETRISFNRNLIKPRAQKVKLIANAARALPLSALFCAPCKSAVCLLESRSISLSLSHREHGDEACGAKNARDTSFFAVCTFSASRFTVSLHH